MNSQVTATGMQVKATAEGGIEMLKEQFSERLSGEVGTKDKRGTR